METEEKMIPNGNWRSENIRKATEARMKKRAALKEAEESNALVCIDETEKFLDKSIIKFEGDSNISRLKADFYKVFDKLGGVSGMVAWVRADKRHRMEYYKLFVGLLKAESNKQVEGQKQQVIVNIISPDKGKEVITDVRTSND